MPIKRTLKTLLVLVVMAGLSTISFAQNPCPTKTSSTMACCQMEKMSGAMECCGKTPQPACPTIKAIDSTPLAVLQQNHGPQIPSYSVAAILPTLFKELSVENLYAFLTLHMSGPPAGTNLHDRAPPVSLA
jgi:hypothetical protein